MGADREVRVAGETLLLLPERAAFWARQRTLILADTHWGKAAAFRAAGFPVSEATTADGLLRLDTLVRRFDPRRIIYLGDYLHAAEGRTEATFEALREWGRTHRDVEQLLVRGNHDRGAGDPPAELNVRCVEAPFEMAPFSLRHFPAGDAAAHVLAGHIHPAARMTGPGRQRERLPCFWLQERCTVLPAFGAFTGSADVTPSAGDRVFVIAGDSVMEVAISRDLR
jgi:uncharacterized protein